jgi:DNA-binding winged helix-turn-helix (wHTH) protein
MSLISRDLYRFDDFELQPFRRTLLRGGEKVALAPKTFEVFVCLVSRAGEVVLKEELFKEVWPESFVEESNLTQHIFWIRKALADKAEYDNSISRIVGASTPVLTPLSANAGP